LRHIDALPVLRVHDAGARLERYTQSLSGHLKSSVLCSHSPWLLSFSALRRRFSSALSSARRSPSVRLLVLWLCRSKNSTFTSSTRSRSYFFRLGFHF